jgi:hypothetical protein
MSELGAALSEGKCPVLRLLNFTDTGANEQAFASVSIGLASCPLLEELVMSVNHAGAAGIMALSRALRAGACRRLTHLDISENGGADAGVEALGAALEADACPQLRTLAVENTCGNGVLGVPALLKAIETGASPELSLLNIRGNCHRRRFRRPVAEWKFIDWRMDIDRTWQERIEGIESIRRHHNYRGFKCLEILPPARRRVVHF